MADDIYSWIKALHIIAVVAWMAGLLYLPRLFVYHCDAPLGTPQGETFKIMERRLLRAIINPGMVFSLVFGAILLSEPGSIDWDGDIWVYLKLAFVVLLLVMHGLMARWQRAFEANENRHNARFFRCINEVPTLALIAIVIFVVVKPF